jgi:hypothetical protein
MKKTKKKSRANVERRVPRRTVASVWPATSLTTSGSPLPVVVSDYESGNEPRSAPSNLQRQETTMKISDLEKESAASSTISWASPPTDHWDLPSPSSFAYSRRARGRAEKFSATFSIGRADEWDLSDEQVIAVRETTNLTRGR